MSRHSPLSSDSHKTLRVSRARRAELGDAEMCCLAVPAEFRDAQAHYPIVFQKDPSRDGMNAVALFGFTRGENLFLNARGWDARYVPLAMETKPFLVGLDREGGDSAHVHIDLDHPRVDAAQGERVFDDQGQPTPFLQAMTGKLGRLHEGYQASRGFFEALERHELLEPFSLEITLEDGSHNQLVGFQTIGEARLQALDAAVVAELHAAGHLMPIFMVVASLSNFADLVRRKNESLVHA
ncbi:SapC family protein [Maricaulis parjimensis]|uniref:SapC family protein n=1 Tax=Maricaulis parjimensis TaxID=144023 RepID=UPI00193AB1BC|nr:SapC family protein [Maricaulis parjimensis]